jgi:hypothetical protein
MTVPFEGGGIGIDVNGTWWFNEFLGATGIIDVYTSLSNTKWTIFSMRAGISAKF